MGYQEPLHIVVTDDNEIDAELIIEALEREGVGETYHHCESGPALLAYLRSSSPRPCLVLLDLRMPGMDGLDVLRCIRADRSLRDIVIYVYSTSGAASDVSTAYDTGVQGYLKKPSTDDELARVLHAMDVALNLFILPYPTRD